MGHCPGCGTALSESADVKFVETAAETGIFKASNRFYLTACGDCGAAIGTDVAGAKA